MNTQIRAVRLATTTQYIDWLIANVDLHTTVIDEAMTWRVKAKASERKSFDKLVARLTSSVLVDTCDLRERMASNPVGRLGDYDGYDINAVRVGLDDAVRAMLDADLRAADAHLKRCYAKFESILSRKRESVTPNRRITMMQRSVVTALQDDVVALRDGIIKLLAVLSEST